MSEIKNIHFIAGLPRSGSTLLSAILRQNPDVHAAMSSPLSQIISSAIAGMSGQNDFYRIMTNKQREAVLRGIFASYYTEIPNTWIFDTNRNWPARLPLITRLFPKAKIICCVRDLVSILNSFEHLAAQSPYTVSRLFGWNPSLTIYGRYERLMSPEGPVGRAHQSLKEGYYGEYSDRLLFIEYGDLVSNPSKTIAALYKALEISAFQHDFENLSYQEALFDAELGMPHMHTVRQKVSVDTKPLILPEDLVQRLRGAEFWRRPHSRN